MADSKREIERKYEATAETRLPDLRRVAGVSDVVHQGVMELDAVYYDTADLRLAAGSLTLRRRTGGDDAGWHLSSPWPPASATRSAPRSPTHSLPAGRTAPLQGPGGGTGPAVRLLSTRDVHHLLGADGTLLAELSIDEVLAERLGGEGAGRTTAWTEIEVELADDGDPAFLDAVERRLGKAGVQPSVSASKMARALAETVPVAKRPKGNRPKSAPARPVTTFSPTSATRRRRSSPWTPPYAAVSPTPSTGCGSPPAGCAARCAPTARSSTVRSPARSPSS
ncbi:CYTH domain-containing protein [Streptomyces sp. M10(2022)]